MKMKKTLNKLRTNIEEELFSSFNSNDNSPDNYSVNTCEFKLLYILDKKNIEINKDSSNPIKINDENIIKFERENNPLKELLKKKTKRNVSSSKHSKPKKPRNSNKKKRHTASDDDNILRKIQVQFLKFIISYTNDIIRSLINDKNIPHFKDLDYEIKKIVSYKFVELLKSSKLEDIVKLRITPKIKDDENINEHIYNLVLEKCPIIQKFFDESYISLFKKYYENKNNIFIFNGKVISLSPKTKACTFNSLINKNYLFKEKIRLVCINYYLNSYKRVKKPKFKTNSSNKSNQNKKIK